jgi:nitroreductase
METWDAIRARRNVRQYRGEPIPDGQLDRILEAGRRAPSARNRQPWDFVVVTDADQLDRLSHVWSGGAHVARSAATIALVTPQPTGERQRTVAQFDLGQATMAMMLAAADLGIGSGHSSVADQDLAREVLGYPEDRVAAS